MKSQACLCFWSGGLRAAFCSWRPQPWKSYTRNRGVSEVRWGG